MRFVLPDGRAARGAGPSCRVIRFGSLLPLVGTELIREPELAPRDSPIRGTMGPPPAQGAFWSTVLVLGSYLLREVCLCLLRSFLR